MLRNFSSYGPLGNRLFIGLDYTLPPARRLLMLQLARQHPLVLDSPAPVVRIASFDDSAIRYEWLVWQKDYGQRLRLRGDLMEQLWYALRRKATAFHSRFETSGYKGRTCDKPQRTTHSQ